MRDATKIAEAFKLASEQYQALGVDVQAALKRLSETSISVRGWQGDDVAGFESDAGTLGDGLAVKVYCQQQCSQ